MVEAGCEVLALAWAVASQVCNAISSCVRGLCGGPQGACGPQGPFPVASAALAEGPLRAMS